MPAGHFEGGETAIKAAQRELFEEVGVMAKLENLEFVHFVHAKAELDVDKERVDVFFRAKSWEGEPYRKEPEKCSEAGWFDLKNLPKPMVPKVKFVLEQINQGKSYSNFNW